MERMALPVVGQTIEVRGMVCTLTKLRPMGTLDVQAPNGVRSAVPAVRDLRRRQASDRIVHLCRQQLPVGGCTPLQTICGGLEKVVDSKRIVSNN